MYGQDVAISSAFQIPPFPNGGRQAIDSEKIIMKVSDIS